MPGLLPRVDPDGLLEYSVVFSDRSLNQMSAAFSQVMKDISAALKSVYRASATAVVPGGGTYGMEAVARQFGTGRHCLVIRNGWFSYRWSQIFETGQIPSRATVLKARPADGSEEPSFAPPPLGEAVATIEAERPDVVFAPHVETASGILLPDDYLAGVAEAARRSGALFVLDAIASGAVWVDMEQLGVDVLISAPQKGWSSSPGMGLVLFGPTALERMESTAATSFSCDLAMWLKVMRAYESDSHTYHCTMPTDALRTLRDTIAETRDLGFDLACKRQWELGNRVRSLLASRGFKSVAAPGFEAPGVVVSHTRDAGIHTGKHFAQVGLQTAAGVPLRCGEPAGFRTFRLGLFGLDKLKNVDRTVQILEDALDRIGGETGGGAP